MKFFSLIVLCITLSFGALTPISVQLAWKNQFQFAGFYVAQNKGFYQEEDIDVTLKEHAIGIDVTEEVVQGRAHFGVGKSSLLLERAAHKPVIALMALFQHSPSVLITTNPAIHTPKDLKDKRIMMTSDSLSSATIMSMLTAHGLKPHNIVMQSPSYNIQDLIDGHTDAMSCYLSNEALTLQKNHIPYMVFNPTQFGFDFYGDILFTSDAMIQNNPHVAKAFYKATKKGWEWAWEHIEESAKIIYDHYNTQQRSLEELIQEGYALKAFAFEPQKPYGILERSKFEHIAYIYQLNGHIFDNTVLDTFIDPLHFAKRTLRIGVLASREAGFDAIPISWRIGAEQLSNAFPSYRFVIVPLEFEELSESVDNDELDFVITNPVHFIQLEHRFGISQLASMSTRYNHQFYSKYGSLIFTKNTSPLRSIDDIQGHRIGAVSPSSLGGYLAARKVLKDRLDPTNLQFLGTHFSVLQAVSSGAVDVGIMRTDLLERWHDQGLINLLDFKVLSPKKYPSFPFAISSDLYPEWVLAKASQTPENLSNEILGKFLILSTLSNESTYPFKLNSPHDYSAVRALLKEFEIYPYEQKAYSLSDVLEHYKFLFIGLAAVLLISWTLLVYIQRLNHKITLFNHTLEKEVADRTHTLTQLNAQLSELANTDELTQIPNRRYFFFMAIQYFHAAKRNQTPLSIFSLDIDFFKNINDTYGHNKGDEVLQFFAHTIVKHLRKSDIFGRIGGEEFAICLQNTPQDRAWVLAEKIRANVETAFKDPLNHMPAITVSIGISHLHHEDTDIFDIVKRSDEALYLAKNSGRNQVQCVT